jgi:hypothetical protein
MSVASFNNLLDLLQPWLQVNLKQSCNASKGKQPIAGGSVHDIHVCAGMSVSSFYRAVRRGVDAINACSSLAIQFPVTLEKLKKSASDF